LIWVAGFVVTFVIGGLTGVMLASVPLDLQLHDSYFVVAHFHYVLVGGAVFPLLGAIHYWFPKMTGRMMSEGLGKLAFGLVFLGFNAAFFPMHVSGILGMPRRVYTYPENMGWDTPNMIASIGAFVFALGILVYVANALISLKRGALAGDNPWDAPGFEWATSSPPPSYNFPHIPVSTGRTPLWEHRGELPVMTGLRVDDREMLLTTVIEARPDLREPAPEPTLWPFISAVALAVVLICSMFTPWAVLLGTPPVAAALIAWFWPKEPQIEPEPVIE
jgi:cytochrome c oxidase subunit 1